MGQPVPLIDADELAALVRAAERDDFAALSERADAIVAQLATLPAPLGTDGQAVVDGWQREIAQLGELARACAVRGIAPGGTA